MEVNEKLALLRRRAGWSQEQLADRLGVTRQSVSKWESGTAVPELGKLVALSELFGVSVDYLVKAYLEEPDASGGPAVAQEADAARLEEKVDDLARYFRGYRYTSKTRIFGLPLVSIRLSRRGFSRDGVAVGIIAIGNVAVGAVSLGAASLGVLSLGALAAGGAAFGALAVGLWAVGALAVGIAAVGSCAIGVYAGGVVALGREIAVGVAALAPTAVGQEAVGQHVLLWGDGLTQLQVEAFLLEHHPKLWRPLLQLLCQFGAHIR